MTVLSNRADAVSIVMRCKNEVSYIEQTLLMLKKQDYNGLIELIVIDSGSTDGSLKIIEQSCPDILLCIEPHEYIPGRVINKAMELSSNNLVIFLNADATPKNKYWLSNLLSAASYTQNLGAVFCRQITRKNCLAVYSHDYEKCFGKDRLSEEWDNFFSMVGSLVYKPVWENHKFREDLQYAEDDEWTRRLKHNRYNIVYAEDSIVIHSHNYNLHEAYIRSIGDTKASTQAGILTPFSLSLSYHVLLGSITAWLKDIPYHLKKGKVLELPYALGIRLAQRYGQWVGNRIK